VRIAADATIARAARYASELACGEGELIGFPGGADLVRFVQAGIPGVIMGPGALTDAHAPAESVCIDQLVAAAVAYAVAAQVFLCGGDER
jgi:acetylornithine deacetylase